MSDFFQSGLISTLHRLRPEPLNPLVSANEARVGVLIPCHWDELKTPALRQIREILDSVECAAEVIVSINGGPDNGESDARRFWSMTRVRPHLLWNDRSSFLDQLQKRGIQPESGKGFNLWSGVGYVLNHLDLTALVIHDGDIRNYSSDLPVALIQPIASLGYRFCKGYYSRVQEQLYGRVTRLFLIPLIRAFIRTLGHNPLLDFIDSFRYPLAGEMALDLGLAKRLPVGNGWAVEIDWLCEVHRLIEPAVVCQVDLAMRYEHKHQVLDPQQPNRGLLRMARDIGIALLVQLERDGFRCDAATLAAVQLGFKLTAADFVRRYADVAELNRISFDVGAEKSAVDAFAAVLREAAKEFLAGIRPRALPAWSQIDEPQEIIFSVG
jgi:glucosyl-3-phosphoglycerate synthase